MALDSRDTASPPPAAPMRVMFLVRSLGLGGAERQLVTLAAGLAARGHAVRIITCYEPGPLAAGLEQHGIGIASLGQSGALALVGPLARLQEEVARWRPDVLHGYMPTSNLLTTFASGGGNPFMVWGVRASTIEWGQYGLLARASFGLTRLLARRADLIIANSEAGRRFHIAEGYPADRMLVIPNGVDITRFRPDAEARAAVRASWRVPAGAIVIGCVARLDPMKDHLTLLRAIAAGRDAFAGILFVCVGSGAPGAQRELAAAAEGLGVGQQVRWVEPSSPVERLYNAFDVHTSASAFGEGFSNAVAEAMACGVPGVATDVGDVALLLGETGVVVPPRDPAALAHGWQQVLSGDHQQLGTLARERIVAKYSVDRLVRSTEAALRALVASPRRRA